MSNNFHMGEVVSQRASPTSELAAATENLSPIKLRLGFAEDDIAVKRERVHISLSSAI